MLMLWFTKIIPFSGLDLKRLNIHGFYISVTLVVRASLIQHMLWVCVKVFCNVRKGIQL